MKTKLEIFMLFQKSLRSIKSLLDPNTATMISDKPELIVMCGLPACELFYNKFMDWRFCLFSG
jgi:hypothetical protein